MFDPILVTALVIDNGEDMAIFLSADVVVLRNHIVEAVREKVAQRNPEIPVEKIIMNATHTHTGPSIYGDTEPSKATGSVTSGIDEIPHEGIEVHRR